MPKDRRTDDLTRALGQVSRRKRRSLEYVGAQLVSGTLTPASTASPSTGGGGSTHCQTSCPNMGPIDGGIEYQTAQSTGTVVGHVYADVVLASVGMIAGLDLVSFCYDGRVGPSTSPIELFCGNTFGLFESGLLAAPTFEGGLGDWTVLRGTWETEQDPGGKWVLKGHPQPDIFDHTSTGEDSRQGDWALIKYDPVPDREQVYLHFRYQRQGVGTGTYNIGDNVGGRWHTYGSVDTQKTGSDLRVRWGQDTSAGGGETWDWWKGNYNNLQVTTEATLLGPSLGIATAAGGSFSANLFSMRNQPIHFYVNTDSGSTDAGLKYQSEWVNQEPVFNADVLQQTNTIHADQAGHLSIAVYNSITQTGLYGWPAEEVGWWKIYDVLIMKDRKVSWDVGSSGRFVKLSPVSGGGTFKSYTPFGSSTAGLTDSYPVWRPNFSTGAPGKGGTWGASYPLDFIEVHASSVMSSTTLLASCNEALVYGGDVWGYSSAGFSTVGTAVSTDCEVKIKLNFIDGAGAIISTIGSTVDINTYAFSRVTGGVGVPIPTNAVIARFTQIKTGAGDCFGVTDDLQFNVGDCCCPYSPPLLALLAGSAGAIDWSTLGYGLLPSSIGGQAVTQIWSTADASWVTGSDMFDAHAEHRTSPVNVLVGAHSEVVVPPLSTAASTGDVNSTASYTTVAFSDYGLSTSDKFSLRFQARTSTA